VSTTETAYVDRKLKNIVEILSRFKGIEIFESCQGYKEYAYICINCKCEIFTFASQLASILARMIRRGNDFVSPEYDIDLSIQWDGYKEEPFLLIQFPNADIDTITRIFYSLGSEFVDGKNNIPR